ncbi:hypothetical protein BDB00DRAFT_938946 [Zychaea mexicana]|uniref:uncharacterized protein n=1 Tax=Zychaea mexicana TaxID=64656 RepID=UPI0022FDE054|nr:uncharacterized protein BDB00DRAFT_938946 [Zychaea mexicana]KAI9493617.1 hypothetical protein BDB00DRAFT_938946 [Zychaea mexicana]
MMTMIPPSPPCFDSRAASPVDTTISVTSKSSCSSSEDLYTPPPSPPLKKRKVPMEWYPGTIDLFLQQQARSADLYSYKDDNERPYKCQVDGCDKAYKNANGLKYHKAHGHCHEKQQDESELIAKKPYRCSIGICNKRYKNLNGLKYHIEHTHLAKLRQHYHHPHHLSSTIHS